MTEQNVRMADLIGVTVAAGLAGRLSRDEKVPADLKHGISEALLMLARAVGDVISTGDINPDGQNQGILVLTTESNAHVVAVELDKFTDPEDTFWTTAPSVSDGERWGIINCLLAEGRINEAVLVVLMQAGCEYIKEWAAAVAAKDSGVVPAMAVLTVMKLADGSTTLPDVPPADGQQAMVGGFITIIEVPRKLLEMSLLQQKENSTLH